jgi:hypothetical protein
LAILSRPDSVSDTRQAPFEGSFRVTALHPRPKAARFYGEFDKSFVLILGNTSRG